MVPTAENSAKRWTYDEYYRLTDEKRYEIIDGNLLTVPTPDTWHQEWVGTLFVALHAFIKEKGLGHIYLSPLDVVLDQENTVQPDLVFVGTANSGIIKRQAIFGAPDLLVEIVSPGSQRRDRYEKKSLYGRFGVKEYWLGDAANRSMEILTLKGNSYELLCAAEESGRLFSTVLTGLEFDLARTF